jgi:LPS export ABC transporter protein LptC
MMRYVWPAALGALLVLIVQFAMREDASAPGGQQDAAQPRYTVRGAQWRRLDPEGKPMFDARAETIDYYDDRSAKLSQIELTALAGRGAPWKMTAPQGEALDRPQRLHLIGGVEGNGRWPDGETLAFHTPDLWMDADAEILHTESAVDLRSASRAVSGRGLRVDGKSQKLWLEHDVDVHYVAP